MKKLHLYDWVDMPSGLGRNFATSHGFYLLQSRDWVDMPSGLFGAFLMALGR